MSRCLSSVASEFGELQVFQNEDYRWLCFDGGVSQSVMRLDQPWQLVLPYHPLMLASLLFNSKPKNILLAGLGGGELVRYFSHYRSAATITVVEKCRPVIDAFHTFFGGDTIEGVQFSNTDICGIAESPVVRFDSMCIDVYGADALPPCLYEKQFYQACRDRLADEGVAAFNLLVSGEQEALTLLRLLRDVFDKNTLCLNVGEHMNLVVLAFSQMPSLTIDDIRQKIALLEHLYELDFSEMLDNLIQTNPNDGLTLFA